MILGSTATSSSTAGSETLVSFETEKNGKSELVNMVFNKRKWVLQRKSTYLQSILLEEPDDDEVWSGWKHAPDARKYPKLHEQCPIRPLEQLVGQ